MSNLGEGGFGGMTRRFLCSLMPSCKQISPLCLSDIYPVSLRFLDNIPNSSVHFISPNFSPFQYSLVWCSGFIFLFFAHLSERKGLWLVSLQVGSHRVKLSRGFEANAPAFER